MGKPTNTATLEDLTNAIVACGNLLVREAGKIFKPLKLSPAQFNVLHLLHLRGDGLRPSDISHSLVVDPASATYLMDTMEKRGWIQRGDDAKDRRVYRIHMTKAGHELHDQAAALYQSALIHMTSELGNAAEVKVVAGFLGKIPASAMAASEAVVASLPIAVSKPVRAKRAKVD